MRLKHILSALLLCICSLAHGTAYYISTTGSDTASGLSPVAAWQTTAHIYTITFAAGDSLLLKGGETFDGLIYLGPEESGTPTHPIVITSYGGGTATVNAGNGAGIFGYNNEGITISNLIIKGSGDSINTSTGIYFYIDTPGDVMLSNITIDSVEVYGFHDAGIGFSTYPADMGRSGWGNINITHAATHDNGNVGISVSGIFLITDTLYTHHSIYIGHCTGYNNRGTGSGINGSGIVVSQADSVLIEYCEAYNNGVNGTGGVGIWAWDANRVIIQHCESHHNHTTTSDGDGFDLDGGVTNSVMQYNYAHDNDGAGYLVWQFDGARPHHGNVVRYNVSENDSRTHAGYYGMVAIGAGDSTVNSGVHNLLVYNNTFFKNRIPGSDDAQGPAVSLSGDLISGVRVYNNIFVLDRTSRFVYLYNNADIKFLNNNYSSNTGFRVTEGDTTYTSLADWATATHQEMNDSIIVGHTEDPLLANPGMAGTIGDPENLHALIAFYALTDGSTMIDSATDLFAAYSIYPGAIDLLGSTLPLGMGYDLGACEHISGPLCITPTHEQSNYTVYPNPCKDVLTILPASSTSTYRLTIQNFTGQPLLSTILTCKTNINIATYPAGIYLLTLSDVNSSETIKVIKE